MSSSRVSEASSVSYDFSSLKGGFLFDARSDKKVGWLLLVALAAPWAVSILISLLASKYKLHSSSLTVLIGRYLAQAAQLILSLIVVYGLVWAPWLRRRVYQYYRQKFADANNLEPVDGELLKGLIPSSLQVDGAYNQKASGYKLNFGNSKLIIFDFYYAEGYGKQKRNYDYALATLQFSKDYPHLFLDGRQNGSNHQYASGQKVNLEGDFNKYFDLYIPEGSEAGALTVFSPDIMQTMIDTGRAFDMEIDGTKADIMTLGLAFTKDNLQKMLLCASKMSTEFKHLDKSWQPVYSDVGQPFVLKPRKTVIITLITLLGYLVVYVAYAFYQRAHGK